MNAGPPGQGTEESFLTDSDNLIVIGSHVCACASTIVNHALIMNHDGKAEVHETWPQVQVDSIVSAGVSCYRRHELL